MSLLAIFIASFLGSPHCAGMCGGFVAFYSSQKPRALLPHVFYSVGRLITYLCFGVVAGLIGASINKVGDLAGVQRTAAVLIGAIMVAWGLGNLFGLRIFSSIKRGFFEKLLRPLQRLLAAGPGNPILTFLLGISTTFLPCGWLYTYVALAAASGSAWSGALVMTVFWLGTLPVMCSLAGITSVLSLRARAYIPRVTASLMIIAGLFSLSGRFEVISKRLMIVEQPSDTGAAAPVPKKHSCH